jgi:hypothetical protein
MGNIIHQNDVIEKPIDISADFVTMEPDDSMLACHWFGFALRVRCATAFVHDFCRREFAAGFFRNRRGI